MIGKVIGIGIILWVLSQRKSSQTAVQRPAGEQSADDITKVEDPTEIEEIENPEEGEPTHIIIPGNITPVRNPSVPVVSRPTIQPSGITMTGMDWKTRTLLRRKKRS